MFSFQVTMLGRNCGIWYVMFRVLVEHNVHKVQLKRPRDLWSLRNLLSFIVLINRLTPDDPYMGRTAPLTSKRCILYIQQI